MNYIIKKMLTLCLSLNLLKPLQINKLKSIQEGEEQVQVVKYTGSDQNIQTITDQNLLVNTGVCFVALNVSINGEEIYAKDYYSLMQYIVKKGYNTNDVEINPLSSSLVAYAQVSNGKCPTIASNSSYESEGESNQRLLTFYDENLNQLNSYNIDGETNNLQFYQVLYSSDINHEIDNCIKLPGDLVLITYSLDASDIDMTIGNIPESDITHMTMTIQQLYDLVQDVKINEPENNNNQTTPEEESQSCNQTTQNNSTYDGFFLATSIMGWFMFVLVVITFILIMVQHCPNTTPIRNIFPTKPVGGRF